MKTKCIFLTGALLALLIPAITFGQWVETGNGLGAAGILGTTTNFGFNVITNNVQRMNFPAGGNVGIGSPAGGATTPQNTLLIENGATLTNIYATHLAALSLTASEVGLLSVSNLPGSVDNVSVMGLVDKASSQLSVGVLGTAKGNGSNNIGISGYASGDNAGTENTGLSLSASGSSDWNLGVAGDVSGASTNGNIGINIYAYGSSAINFGTYIGAYEASNNNTGGFFEARDADENYGVVGEIASGDNSASECTGVLGHMSEGGEGVRNYGVRGDLDDVADVNSGDVYYAVVGTVGNNTTGAGADDEIQLSAAGNIYAGYFEGDVYSTDTYYSSDEKLKNNVKEYNGALNQLEKLPVKQYTFDRQKYPGMNLPVGLRMGVMASDMKEVFPNLVKKSTSVPSKTDKEIVEFDAVNYNALIPVLIQGVKELNAASKEKDEVITDLTKQITDLKNLYNDLCSFGCGEFIPTGVTTPSVNSGVKLFQNVPNPAGNSTIINYAVEIPFSKAGISVFDMQGRVVKFFEIGQTGTGSVNFVDEIGTSSIYKYALIVDGKVYETRTMNMINR
jgi:hypothetical protein